ncbi:hypothetical protein [Actinoplanes sp. NPDC049802]|uniref:hypothetical protein n=1 Tax=Actinoplanes sp. NPDC049802 TaxID=3154742 RepID=UPI00340FD5CB
MTTNVRQPEMRRSGESPTTEQRTGDAHRTEALQESHDKTGHRKTPAGQTSPYGPSGATADDGDGDPPGA